MSQTLTSLDQVSGTTASTVVLVEDMISSAFRKLKQPTPLITGEMVNFARLNLYLLCQTLVNKGVPLWCVTPLLLATVPGQVRYPLPTGTLDITNARLRTLSRADNTQGTASATSGTASLAFDDNYATICAEAAVGNQIEFQFTTPPTLTTFGYLPGQSSTSLRFNVDHSPDGVNWTTLYTSPAGQAYTDEVWFLTDLPVQTLDTYWRVISTADLLSAREILLGYAPNDIPMGKLNRDDISNLPNPYYSNDYPLQYWLDMQRDAPVLQCWPAPNSKDQLFNLLIQRPIMDVGMLYNRLDVPLRWYEAIIYELASRLADEVPRPVPPDVRQSVESKRLEYSRAAWNREVDGMPINLVPAMRRYTR